MAFEQITYGDFDKVKIAVGKVVSVDDFPEARKPAYKLTIDFGEEIGIKKSSAQLTDLYEKDEIVGKLVLAVVNFPPRQIGPFMSEVLTLGVPVTSPEDPNQGAGGSGVVALVVPDRDVPLGGVLF